VGRRWLTGRPQLARRRARDGTSDALSGLDPGWLDIGGLDLGEGGLVVLAVVACLLVLIPILFFGIELIILGGLLAGGVVAHTVLRQPWVVQAISSDPVATTRQLEWRVRGWRRSGRLIGQVAADLAAGCEPEVGATVVE
jgi:hypothetical protein